MEPTLWGGGLAVVRKQHDYGTGDIIAFRVEGGMVIHRIVGEEADGFVTQGDNRDSPDSWRPTNDDIVGRVWFSVPGGGRFVYLLRQPVALGAVAGALGMLTILLGPGWHLSLPVPGRRKRRRDQESGAGDRSPPLRSPGLGLVLSRSEEGKTKRPPPPSPPQTGWAGRRSPPLFSLGLGLFLVVVVVLLATHFAAHRSGKWL
jgi:hypothetical protein